MEEEEEDRVLLHSLGVTSANAEDIERNILEQVLILLLISYMALKCFWLQFGIVHQVLSWELLIISVELVEVLSSSSILAQHGDLLGFCRGESYVGYVLSWHNCG